MKLKYYNKKVVKNTQNINLKKFIKNKKPI